MARYNKIWQRSGSSLTINYPDELVDIIEDASTYFSVNDEANKNLEDAILIVPKNGSFVFDNATEETTIETINDHTQQVLDTKTDTPKSLSIQRLWNFDINSWLRDVNVEYNNDKSKLIHCYLYNIAAYSYSEEQLFNGGSLYVRFTTTITIEGIPNYFKSNADFYFAIGKNELDEDREMVFAHDFKSDKGIVGGYVVKDNNFKVLDVAVNDLTRYIVDRGHQYNNHNLLLKWYADLGTTSVHDSPPFRQMSSEVKYLNEDDYKVNGFDCSIRMANRWQLDNIKKIDFRDKIIDFVFDELVAVSDGRVDSENACVLKKDGLHSADANKGDITMLCPNTHDVFNYEEYDALASRAWWPRFMFTTRGNIKALLKNISYVDVTSRFTNKKGMFAYEYGYVYGNPNRLVVNKANVEIPLFACGLNLYPVFTETQCAYFKLNCTSYVDYGSIYKNEENPQHKKIMAALSNKYGEQGYLYTNESTWENWTIDQKIQQIKDCKCPLKVVFINAPSTNGKDKKTKIVLSYRGNGDRNNNYITYDHIQQLLGEKRENEYYIIICNSNYAGGLFEKDVQTENYALVNVSDEFNANYMLQWADNANSQTYRNSTGNCVGDVVQYGDLGIVDTDSTYGNNNINADIENIRNANLQLVKEFYTRQYLFIQSLLLSPTDEHYDKWNEYEYSTDANEFNQIIAASSDRNKAVKKNPFVYCYVLFHYMVNPWFKDVGSWQKGIDRSKFIIDKSNIKSLLLEYINGFIDIQRFIKKNKLGFIKLNSEIVKYFTALIDPKAVGSIFNGYKMNDLLKQSEIRNTFNTIIDFFLDLHKCRAEMYDNSHSLMQVNGVYHPWSFLLEDTPGVKAAGTPEFLDSKIFEFPGYESDTAISDDAIEHLIYQEDGSGSSES